MFPIVLRANGRRAVVVGGGTVALRKAESLDAAGWMLFVVAPAIDDRLRALLSKRGTLAQRRYGSADLAGAVLVVAATDDDAVNARVVADAQAAGILCCDATDAQRGDVVMPAVLRNGALSIAVDTGTPAFSKRIVRELATLLGPQYGLAAQTLSRMRTYVKAALPPCERGRVLQTLAELPVGELAAMNAVAAEHEIEATVARVRTESGEAANAAPAPPAICATRASALAMTQTRAVAARLAERGIPSTILTVTTAGDRDRARPIDALGVSVFVKELEVALREGRADYAVHSCKDLPSELPVDMLIAAISTREDARDAFCSERYAAFEALPAGAVVGTSSPRRRAALAALRSDLEYREMRGNVDTRLRKLRDGEFDAIVLAMAGLQRLGVRATHTAPFSLEQLVPAAGQGALAIETRAGAPLAEPLRDAVNDPVSERCVTCERAVLHALRAGCSAPVGVHARPKGGELEATGFVVAPGGRICRARVSAAVNDLDQARALGLRLAALLAGPLAGRLVLLPRTGERVSAIAAALRELGAEVAELRAGDDGPDPAERIPDMLLFPSSGSVEAAGPYLARLRALGHRPPVAAMGPRSGDAARAAGFAPDAVAAEASASALVALALERLAEAPR